MNRSEIKKVYRMLLGLGVLLFLCGLHVTIGFTCQGTDLRSALTNCPDRGAQSASCGGNTTIYVKSANNLPNRDFAGPAAGISDPYVKFTISDVDGTSFTYTTRAIQDTLNPEWNQYVNLGVLSCATKITVEIWDKDSGLEFGDDLMVSAFMRVPFCSTITANYTEVTCADGPFGCSSEGSLWAMPNRQECVESGEVSFVNGKFCSEGICLTVEVHIVPFVLGVELLGASAVSTPEVSVASNALIAGAYQPPFMKSYGYPFINSVDFWDWTYSPSSTLKGALTYRFRSSQKYIGEANSVIFYGSSNFPAWFYLCRDEEDNDPDIGVGVPEWLGGPASLWDDSKLALSALQMYAKDTSFECFRLYSTGTVKNKYGGVMSGVIPFRANTVAGSDTGIASAAAYKYMYTVLAIPETIVTQEDTFSVIYDIGLFIEFIFTLGLGIALFTWVIFAFMEKLNYRIDRIPAFLATRVLTGDQKSVLAGLFLVYHDPSAGPQNIAYRAHMYHAVNVFYFILLIPFALLFSAGYSCSNTIRPQGLGYSIAYIGSAALLVSFAMKTWQRQAWRLTNLVFNAFYISVSFFFVFLIYAVFSEASVVGDTKATINLPALSLVFGTINVMPLILMVFRNDKSQQDSLQVVADRFLKAVYYSKQKDDHESGAAGKKKEAKHDTDKLLHALLGDSYTINPKVPTFKFSSAFQSAVSGAVKPEPPAMTQFKQHQPTTTTTTTNNNNNYKDAKQAFVSNNNNNTKSNAAQQEKEYEQHILDEEEAEKLMARLYQLSLFSLFVYLIIVSIAGPKYLSLAFLNCCALIFLDFLHVCMSRGDMNWQGGFLIVLLVTGRILIMGSPFNLWILNYSFTYMIYAILLTQEMINTYLPTLSKQAAGRMVFAGMNSSADNKRPPSMDMVGTSFFCQGALTFAFVFILVIGALNVAGDKLVSPQLTVLGMQRHWQTYVFGLISILVTVVLSLVWATMRAFYLKKHGLLRGIAAAGYFYKNELDIPLFLAFSCEFMILTSGLLIYAITNSVAVLVGCIFLPIIIVMLAYAYAAWVNNDYELVQWPPREIEEEAAGKDASDLDVAFNMIENLFGNQGEDMEVTNFDDTPETDLDLHMSTNKKTLKGFKLPPLSSLAADANNNNQPTVTEIKMPPLPLKSVLRRKRQNLGIKTKKPLVKDLQARDGANNDKFGADNDDVIDADDPWAMYEEDSEDEKEKKKKKKTAVMLQSEEGVMMKELGRQSVFIMRYLFRQFSAFSAYLAKAMQPSKKVNPADKYREQADELDEELGLDDGNSNSNRPSSQPKPGSPFSSSKSQGNSLKSGKVAVSGKGGDDGSGMVVEFSSGDVDGLDFGDGDKDENGGNALENKEPEVMSFMEAFACGLLTAADYTALACWFGALFLIMFFGITLSLTITPSYMGIAIWMACWIALGTFVPILKYFMILKVDETMGQFFKGTVLLHVVFCICFFATVLEGDAGQVGALWLFDYFIYYPIGVFLLFEFYRWYDNGFVYKSMDLNADGSISFYETLSYIQSVPFIAILMFLLTWQFYVWVDAVLGNLMVLCIIVCAIFYIYVRDWAKNDYYLTPELATLGGKILNVTLIVTSLVALFSTEPVFAGSVFFFTLAAKVIGKIAGRLILVNSIDEVVVFFSPYVMPVYIYDATKLDIREENEIVLQSFTLVGVGIAWGAFLAVFYYPVHIGVTIACGFLLILVALVALAVTYVPHQLGKCSSMLDSESIVQVASFARDRFIERKQPLQLDLVGDWKVAIADDTVEAEARKRTTVEKLKEKPCISLAVDLLADERALNFTKIDRDSTTRAATDSSSAAAVEDEESDEYELPWHEQKLLEATRLWRKFSGFVAEKWLELKSSLFPDKNKGWARHSQADFNVSDAVAEMLILGKGAWAFLGLEKQVYALYLYCLNSENFAGWVKGWIFEFYDEDCVRLDVLRLENNLDHKLMMYNQLESDEALNYTYTEEFRCVVHFILMVIVGADSKQQRQQVLFQKFLRESRFRLASNGITPPTEIFSSESFASIDIPLVAVWLATLTQDERDRFYQLQKVFADEQKVRDDNVDDTDYQLLMNAASIAQERINRDKEVADVFDRYCFIKREERIVAFAKTLEGPAKQKFAVRRELWCSNPNCFVDFKDLDLYEKFKTACLESRDEVKEFVESTVGEIESAQKDTRLGEYGRAYQYVDSEFPPNDRSLGDDVNLAAVLGWRCAPGISDLVQVFDGGTHPDEIQEGVFQNTWLLSALSMLVAAGDFGNGHINDQILNLFVKHKSEDGDMTINTEVGVYCIQIFRQGNWIPVIVDDLFPMRKTENWTNENRGMASAHNRECRGIWPALVEKAFAKYFGSYAMLKKGYIHHALQDLTGCETVLISLASAARGIGKKSLWNNLRKMKKNGYILGAGTGDSSLVDKEIQDVGIVFNSEYVIYDLYNVNGEKLLHIRNPPGDHEEWRGDWGDKSRLWTRKMKGKVGWSDEEDNTFFISFDDFCNVYRNLYVCKYYNPKKWYELQLPGVWKKSDMKQVENLEMMTQFMAEQGEELVVDQEQLNKTRARCQIDSAGGLPTIHNPKCIFENNPHYSMSIHRPTDLKIAVTQIDTKWNRGSFKPQPFAILLLKVENEDLAKVRVEKLRKEDVIEQVGPTENEKTLNMYVSDLEPGNYKVVVATYLAGMEGSFQISLLTNYRAQFDAFWPPTWLLKNEAPTSKEVEAAEKSGTRIVKTNLKEGGGGGGVPGAAKPKKSAFDKLKKSFAEVFLGKADDFEDSDDEEEGGGES